MDLRSERFLTDPAPALRAAREQGALVRTRLPLIGETWLTTTDAAARRLLKDERFVRDSKAATGVPMLRRFWWMPRFMAPLMENILLKDGDDHRRIRGLVDKAFARAAVDDLRPRLGELADSLLDQIDASRPVDIKSAYARQLPLLAICELLGLPDDDRERITRWIAPISGPTNLPGILLALPGLWRALRHFRHDFEVVRRTHRPGLIRHLVEAEEAGDRLSEDELLSLVFTLFIAGHETTVHLITDAIASIAADAALRGQLADPASLPLAVEEFLRFWSPVMISKSLFALEDLDFDGIAVRRGDMVVASLISANHDPERFDAPEELRAGRRPNAHLGFGHGPHVCLGMQLARAETQTALERLFRRYPDLSLAAAPQPLRRLGIRGFKRLMVRLEPA